MDSTTKINVRKFSIYASAPMRAQNFTAFNEENGDVSFYIIPPPTKTPSGASSVYNGLVVKYSLPGGGPEQQVTGDYSLNSLCNCFSL